jgi:hypothetical protein
VESDNKKYCSAAKIWSPHDQDQFRGSLPQVKTQKMVNKL